MNKTKEHPTLTTLVPIPKENVTTLRYIVKIPGFLEHVEEHFPKGFQASPPATITDAFARDIIKLSEATDEEILIHIDLTDFYHIFTRYRWLPFTLALHALILGPKCSVFLCGTDPIKYSDLIDAGRPARPLNSIRNFVTYLNTKSGDRSRRVYEQLPTGSFISFEYRIMDYFRQTLGFTPNYLSWLEHPYRTPAEDDESIIYTTHPFDQMPVRNRTTKLKDGYLTKTQMKACGLTPAIDKAVLMHDQLETVALKPFWPK